MNPFLLRATGLNHSYSRHLKILEKIDLSLGKGEVILLSGPNGAGKTTLIKILAGLIKPTSGEVHCAEKLSLFLPESYLYADLSLMENLELFSRLYGAPMDKAIQLAESLGLASLLSFRFRHLSRGQKVRASLCRTFLWEAPLILLDEPMGGLDAVSSELVLSLFSRLKSEGKTILFSAPHESPPGIDRKLWLEGGKLT